MSDAIILVLGTVGLFELWLLARSRRELMAIERQVARLAAQLATAESQCDLWRNAAIANDAESRALSAEVAYWHGQTWERQHGLQTGLAAAVEILTAKNGEQITVYRN